ncbi:MAG: hypothetical protein ACYCTI_00115 [Acidimicrobiales bacterium]
MGTTMEPGGDGGRPLGRLADQLGRISAGAEGLAEIRRGFQAWRAGLGRGSGLDGFMGACSEALLAAEAAIVTLVDTLGEGTALGAPVLATRRPAADKAVAR